jgi:hypothetical protein
MQADDSDAHERRCRSVTVKGVRDPITFLVVRLLLKLLQIGPTPDEKDAGFAVLPRELACAENLVRRRRPGLFGFVAANKYVGSRRQQRRKWPVAGTVSTLVEGHFIDGPLVV